MLEVVATTSERTIFEGRAKSVILPGEQGVFEVLPFHKSLLSRLISGRLIIDGNVFPIQRGIVAFNHNKATIIIEE
jgi:F0F1-type ATP synthase epsilon subunit